MTEDGRRLNEPIGFLDSGVGGIAVLRRAIEALPEENFLFLGDIGNAPYGSRPDGEILALSLAATQRLVERGIKALVVACNTATSAAIEEIRARYPEMPVLGMEPAVKPACEALPGGTIAVMATPAALRMPRFQERLAPYGTQARLLSVPCPGLSRLIEVAGPNSAQVNDYLIELFQSLPVNRVDGVVVGCTHYIFVERQIRRYSGMDQIFDGVDGTVRHLIHRLEAVGIRRPGGSKGELALLTTEGSEGELPLFRQFLALED